jgi:hypothetical protein
LISNITRAESNALKSLKRNRDIRILPADRGNCMVIMNKSIYMEKLNTLLESGVYEPLQKDLIRLKKLKVKYRSFCPRANQGFLLN